jgi:anti-anti-sigma factor
MTGQPNAFEIHETRIDGSACLTVTGELDMQSTPTLEARLARFRAVKAPVRLDLSKLEFIDSTGLHMLVRAVGDARIKGWQLRIDPDISQPVRSAFRLVGLDRFLARDASSPGRRADQAPEPRPTERA